MSKLFLALYEKLAKHPFVFWMVLSLSIILCALLASRIKFDENITSFFDNGSDGMQSAVFNNLKIKDKIVVLVSGEDPDEMIDAADVFVENLQPAIDEGLIQTITDEVSPSSMERCIDFVYDYLPIFLTDRDYDRLISAVSDESVEQAVEHVYSLLTSASGMVVGDVVLRDPLNLGTSLLSRFEQFDANLQYELYADRIFTKDGTSMLMFIDPAYGMGNTGQNECLVEQLDRAAEIASTDRTTVTCIGAPVAAVYNARQIKRDTTVTLSIALVIILCVICLSFRNRWSIPLVLLPPAFGAVFALAAAWIIQGSLSAIAIGAGAVVLGVALSYSIHIVSHLNHTVDPRQVITELASPLTIGCLTTIGAFAALMFTSSALLRDIGLFCVFTLIGTTLCCLVFLPQFIGKFDNKKRSLLLAAIERGNGYSYEKNPWVVLICMAVAAVSLFFYNDVRFDSNMSNLNYMPRNVEQAEIRLGEITGQTNKSTYVISSAEDFTTLTERYATLGALLERYKQQRKIQDYVVLDQFVISPDEQEARIARWEKFWGANRTETLDLIRTYARRKGFRKGAFARFEELLNKKFEVCHYTQNEIGEVPALREWIDRNNTSSVLISRLLLDEENKSEVYAAIEQMPGTLIVDRAWFSSILLEHTVDDFNYILLISSLIVFVALFISYGRLELTLLTFLPMCISWVIILGFMAVFHLPFNVVNIILATFIFGIGDDFSIFIMDGLLQEYKNGQKRLAAHKTAIFFSAFTAVVGMGVLIFAKHPALKSIALISMLGLCVVVWVSYTVQPFLFRLFITLQTRRGNFPYTLPAFLNTVYCFLYFLVGCLLVRLYMAFLFVLPLRRQTKKDSLHKVVYGFTRLFLRTMITVKTIRNNPAGESFEKPAVILANHQSFVDILLLLSTTPKIVMLTNSWVWNSPFFGRIVRYADFHCTQEGYDALAEVWEEQVRAGYSIVVFPEGTRSADCSIRRFHKGAFYLAQKLHLDIVPIVIYGTGQISSKRQPFYIKDGLIVSQVMKRIPADDRSWGETYQERAKYFRRWYKEQYDKLNEMYGRVSNPYFRDALMKNYIYKGPVLEWYMRVKCRLDGYYDLWDRLIPRNASIVDVGCGYGQMCFMLGMLAPGRKVLGIDYDSDKIELAKHCFLCNSRITFENADMRELVLPYADAFIFNDSLHYVDSQKQISILSQAVSRLNRNGMILVRDGDASDSQKHAKIENTEKWSTKIIKFNKTTENLSFTDSVKMKKFAMANSLNLQIRKCDKDSSETLYVFRKK